MNKWIFSLLWVGSTALAALSEPDRSLIPYRNLLVNPGFEQGKASWTASGGTFTTTTTAANVGSGNAAGSWDSSSAGQTLTSSSITIPAGLYGASATARCRIQTPSGTATHQIMVYDGTNEISPQTIVSNANYTVSSTTFIMPSSGTIALRLKSVASDEPNINIDDCYLGLNDNVGTVSQSSLVASGFFAVTASCTWSRTSSTLGSFTSTAACPGPTVEDNAGPGVLQTTDVDLPKFTITSLPPGKYVVEFQGPQNQNTASSPYMAINDGTTTSGAISAGSATTNNDRFSVRGVFTYTAAGDRTFELYGSTAANTLTLDLTGGQRNLRFWVWRYPTSSEIAFRPDQSPSFWSGYHTTAASWSRTNTAIGDFTNSGTPAITETNNVNFGTVSTAGSSLPGVTFTPKVAGYYLITASANVTNATANAINDLQLTDGTTVIASGHSRTYSDGANNPHSWVVVTGLYKVATAGSAITVKLQGSANGSSTINLAASGTLRSAIEWSIAQISQNVSVPILVGSITSGNSGALRMEATIEAGASVTTACSGSPCTHYNATNSGAIVASQTSTGNYTGTLSGWSSAPVCLLSDGRTSGLDTICSISVTSSTVFEAHCVDRTNAAVNGVLNIMCLGPK